MKKKQNFFSISELGKHLSSIFFLNHKSFHVAKSAIFIKHVLVQKCCSALVDLFRGLRGTGSGSVNVAVEMC